MRQHLIIRKMMLLITLFMSSLFVFGQNINNQIKSTFTDPNSKDIAGEVVLSEDFEDESLPEGWKIIDNDGDGNNWILANFNDADNPGANGSTNYITSASYINAIGPLTPDNFLITPAINLPNGGTLKYYVSAQDENYPEEHYGIFVSTTGNNVDDFGDTPLFEETLTGKAKGTKGSRGKNKQGPWSERTVNLPAGTKYVAFRHYNCTDLYRLNIDEVEITSKDLDVNMDNYITLKVKSGTTSVSLDFKALLDNTQIMVVSSNTTIIDVGTNWTNFKEFEVNSSTNTIKVYGDLYGFDCRDNFITDIDLSNSKSLGVLHCNENFISSLDLSKSTSLKILYCNSNLLSSLDLSKCTLLHQLGCYDNKFTTSSIDRIYCSLPEREADYKGALYIADKPTDSNIDDILASNSQNAIDKNWEVLYESGDSEIPTTGNFDCSTISINDFANEAELSIYPNPADNVIYIDFENLESVLIYNNIGKLVNEYFDNTIDVSSYNSGVYLIKVTSKEGKIQTSKIIIK